MTAWQCRECRALVAPGAPRCPECPSTQFEKPEAEMVLKIARDGSVSDSADVREPAEAGQAEVTVTETPEAVTGTSGPAAETPEAAVEPAADAQAPDAAPEPVPAPAPAASPRTPPRRPPAVPRE